MSDPEDDANREPAENGTSDETRSAPVGDGNEPGLHEHKHADQQRDSDNTEDDAESHGADIATKGHPVKALADVGIHLGQNIRQFRETHDSAVKDACADLIHQLLTTPPRTHADLLALTSLTRAVLLGPRDEMTAEEAIAHSLLFLDQAIYALELDTGVGAEAFTGPDVVVN